MGIGHAAGTLGRGESSAGCGLYEPEISGQADPQIPLEVPGSHTASPEDVKTTGKKLQVFRFCLVTDS